MIDNYLPNCFCPSLILIQIVNLQSKLFVELFTVRQNLRWLRRSIVKAASVVEPKIRAFSTRATLLIFWSWTIATRRVLSSMAWEQLNFCQDFSRDGQEVRVVLCQEAGCDFCSWDCCCCCCWCCCFGCWFGCCRCFWL